MPLVVTGQCIDELPCVYHDDFNGVRELTGLLLRKGRRKLVYIGVFEEDKAAGLARRQGMQQAVRDAGLDADSVPRKIADFNAESGYKCMMELLEEHPDLDGVVCATDIIAHGAMGALKASGRRIPEDVSIAGVGDNWSDMVSTPKLTTLHLHQRRCGSEAAKMLLQMIGEETEGFDEAREPEAQRARQIRLGYRIIERESV